MHIRIPLIKRNEQLFFFSYVIFLTFTILLHSFYYRYFAFAYRYIILLCITILLAQELINKSLSKRGLFGVFVLYGIAFFVVVQGTGDLQTAFACIFLYAFSARNIDFSKVGIITVYITTILLGVVIISALMGIIPNYLAVTSTRKRYYLGFRYALNAPGFFENIVLLTVYLKKDKIKNLTIVILLLISVLLFVYTSSRLSFGVSLGGLLVALINKKRGDNFSGLKKSIMIMIPSFIICTFASLWLTLTYSPSILWMKSLNDFLGNRLRLGQLSLLKYGFKMIGSNELEWVGNGLDMYGNKSTDAYLYVDNMYIQVLQRYGIVFLGIFLVLATMLIIRCYINKNNLMVVMLLIIALRGLIDDETLYLHFNTFWILFGPAGFGYIRNRTSQPQGNKRKTVIQAG